jgi:ferredoxin
MTWHLRLNPITCDGHGLCAELLPEAIVLDDWGYPILSGDPIPPHLLAHARRAVAACPTLALMLEKHRDRRSDRHPQSAGAHRDH